jgi:hypothetical protein
MPRPARFVSERPVTHSLANRGISEVEAMFRDLEINLFKDGSGQNGGIDAEIQSIAFQMTRRVS